MNKLFSFSNRLQLTNKLKSLINLEACVLCIMFCVAMIFHYSNISADRS